MRSRVDLPGVGSNLQDRYEVCVVNRMRLKRWEALAEARFEAGDPLYRAWAHGQPSLYATNGAGLAVITRSRPQLPMPDLFCMALLGRFHGYYPGYAAELAGSLNYLSWSILKAHTQNRAGSVALASADPRDPPRINFRYFEEGSDPSGADLDAVVAGIRYVRGLTAASAGRGSHRGGGTAGCRGAERRRTARLRPRPGLGPPRILHLRHRPARGGRCREQRLSRPRHRRAARGRRLGVSARFPASSSPAPST